MTTILDLLLAPIYILALYLQFPLWGILITVGTFLLMSMMRMK